MKALCACTLALGLVLASELKAQTDYYNTDRGRPVQVEDAYATERYAFELQLAPVRLERARGGVYSWGLEPELAYGLLPRTHLEVGFPFAFVEAGAGMRTSGLAGIDVSMLHNLNAETRGLPALGIAAGVLAPAGNLGPDKAYASAKGIVTRTFQRARFHLNGEYTFGESPSATSSGALELSRWLAGVAIDKTYPLRALLVTAEVFAQQPIFATEEVQWNAGAGLRYQVNPAFALDAGVGTRLTEEQAWFVTFGLARAFAIRSLMPGR